MCIQRFLLFILTVSFMGGKANKPSPSESSSLTNAQKSQANVFCCSWIFYINLFLSFFFQFKLHANLCLLVCKRNHQIFAQTNVKIFQKYFLVSLDLLIFRFSTTKTRQAVNDFNVFCLSFFSGFRQWVRLCLHSTEKYIFDKMCQHWRLCVFPSKHKM